jgi:hypothetical protein
MTTTPTWTLTSEADFIAAEREITSLNREFKKSGADNGRIDELMGAITDSPPPTALACAVKLRLMVDPELALVHGVVADCDIESLKQVVAFLAGRQSRHETPASAPAGTPIAERGALSNARHELESALTEITGLAEVLRNIGGDTDLDEVFPYLVRQLTAHRDKADAAFARLFGLGEHSRLRGGPGALAIEAPAASAGRKGCAA